MTEIKKHPFFIATLIFPAFFLFGIFFENLGLKFFAFLILCVAIYAVTLMTYRWSLFFLFLYIGLEGFLKVVSNYNPVIHVGSDILIVALSLKVLLQVFLEGLPKKNWPPLTRLFLVHFLWLGIVLFNPYSLSLISSIAGAKIYFSMFLLYFYGYYQVNSIKDVRFFMYPFIIVAALHTITGLYQGIYGPAGLVALHPRYATQLLKYQDFAFRPFGLTNIPGGPSVHMYQVFPFLLYILFRYRTYGARLAAGALLPLSTMLFFLCQVRSALLKMLVASGLFIVGILHLYSKTSYRSFRKVLLVTSTLTFVLYFTLPRFFNFAIEASPENDAAIERSMTLFDYDKISKARRGGWDRFMAYSQEVPFGAGFARVGAAAGAFKNLHREDPIFGYGYFFTDNLWLTALVEVGIPGMIFITLLIFFIIWGGIKQYWHMQDEEVKIVNLAILSSLLALVMGLYGAEGLIYNPEAGFFWFFSGVMMKLPSIERQRRLDLPKNQNSSLSFPIEESWPAKS